MVVEIDNEIIPLFTMAEISNGNRTEWSTIRYVIISDNKFGRQRMITDRIGRHEVLLPIRFKITISEKRRRVTLWKKGKINIQNW